MRIKKVTKEFIFDTVGAPTPSVHASTIVKTKEGNVVCAWFGGEKESTQDVRVWIAVCENGVWGNPYCLEDGMDVAHWNPVLFENKKGELCLYYKVGVEIPTWKTYIAKSNDGGHSFGDASELVPGNVGGRGPVKNKPIYLESGRMIAPASDEGTPRWYAFMDISDDDGESFRSVNIEKPDEPYFTRPLTEIQPTLWEEPAGHIHALLRTNHGYAYRTDSFDNGDTWCTSYITTVPNNNSGLDLVKAEDKSLALVYNPTSGHGADRTPLWLAFSFNNGATFEKVLTLEDAKGEYSYPSIIADGKKLHISYTYNRKTIAYACVECY